VPAFYADDAHRILLDVVVPGPGPVADGQVRFMDLLRLGNATLTERGERARGAAGRGPSERRVLCAWRGHETASALRDAAGAMDRGDLASARATLVTARARVDGARASLRELATDPTLGRDLVLCDRFESALETGSPGSIASAMRVAAHRRLLGDPMSVAP
ncbi:MAG: hypothetical protein AB7P00_24040, partial [Sandaracinaceae bacterium]